MALAVRIGPTALPDGPVCELRVDPEVFHLSAGNATLSVRGGPAHAPDAVITMSADTLYRLMSGHTNPADTAQHTTIDGDRELTDKALESLHDVLANPQP
jgi:hypothetical protein